MEEMNACSTPFDEVSGPAINTIAPALVTYFILAVDLFYMAFSISGT